MLIPHTHLRRKLLSGEKEIVRKSVDYYEIKELNFDTFKMRKIADMSKYKIVKKRQCQKIAGKTEAVLWGATRHVSSQDCLFG